MVARHDAKAAKGRKPFCLAGLAALREKMSCNNRSMVLANDTLAQLWATVQQRKEQRPAGSYTVHLLEAGENEILKKIGEEAVEVIIAAKGEGDDRVLYELADLIYHSMVLLAARDLSWEAVEAELARRFG